MPDYTFILRLDAGYLTADAKGRDQDNGDMCRLTYTEVLCKRWPLPSFAALQQFSLTGNWPKGRQRLDQQALFRAWRAPILNQDQQPLDSTMCSFEIQSSPMVVLECVFLRRWMDTRDEALLHQIILRCSEVNGALIEEMVSSLVTAIKAVASRHRLRLYDTPEQGPARLFVDVYEHLTGYRSWLEAEGKAREKGLRQIFTTDATTINAAVKAHRRGTGPRVAARLQADAEVVEIFGALGRGVALQVQTADKQWHTPFACYRVEAHA